ncbi:hypothetical protein H2200_008779 [Cladophialophora chaetospira]|uniref:Uncharacterized protein n=1 Tax=Cladophialophora chaetospira TaxID=386627 RepID=A0AA38X544_9EURO|nr:hypothetical protein H2200_008779 [Cladophialophora chaetospira]
MARPRTSLLSSMCRSCRKFYQTNSRRTLSTTRALQASTEEGQNPLERERRAREEEERRNADRATAAIPEPQRRINRLAQRFAVGDRENREPKPSVDYSEAFQQPDRTNSSPRKTWNRLASKSYTPGAENQESAPTSKPHDDEPYHINVYAHRHNTHITFTEPSRNPIISFSCGNLGLRNAQKASYDASFQLAAYTFRKMAEKQWKLGGVNNKGSWLTLSSIKKPGHNLAGSSAGIEVIMRGFGPGREAFQKALLGTEGRMIKPLICKVTDGTRLKFGGTRSPQVRRLG